MVHAKPLADNQLEEILQRAATGCNVVKSTPWRLRNQQVSGSNPLVGSIEPVCLVYSNLLRRILSVALRTEVQSP